MKPSKAVLPFLTAIAISALPLHAATINLDLTSTNTGNITLDAGSNDFSFTGLSVDYLIVGGGGGGGTPRNSAGRAGGGGGAGGLLTGNTSISGVQSISVGAGGAGGVPGPLGTWQPATNGADSTAFSLTAIGGGRGGANVSGQDSGASGGSGGGAGSSNTVGGVGTVGQGNDGAGGNNGGIGGGGGGAGGAASGQTAGAGAASSITGASLTYAQGGAGGNASAGNYDSGTPGPAAANTGNGGKGVAFDTVNAGGGQAGGSGIVVVRYTGDNLLTGGIVSTVGGDTVHQFTDTGASTLGFNATIAGNIDGAGDLSWNGGGTLNLAGANTYTGVTTVDLGSLLLTGSIGNTGDLIFGVAGLLDLGATGLINVLQSNYSIADADSDILAGFITGADSLQVSTFDDGSNIFTQITVIPEPTTALLGGLGMLFLLRRRRA